MHPGPLGPSRDAHVGAANESPSPEFKDPSVFSVFFGLDVFSFSDPVPFFSLWLDLLPEV